MGRGFVPAHTSFNGTFRLRVSPVMNARAEKLMKLALGVASSAETEDLPIAALIVDKAGVVVSSAVNGVETTGNITAHAEVLALAQIQLTTLKADAGEMTMVVTLEPCPMCAWAIRLSGLGKLVFGSYNPRFGAVGSDYDLLRDSKSGSQVEVLGGVLADECRQLLEHRFMSIRNNKRR